MKEREKERGEEEERGGGLRRKGGDGSRILMLGRPSNSVPGPVKSGGSGGNVPPGRNVFIIVK